MIDRLKDWLLAIAGGVLLALMIEYNSLLAKHTTPYIASWVAHGMGAIVALALVFLTMMLLSRKQIKNNVTNTSKLPLWFYMGGIPGAFTVVLAAIAINGSLSLSEAIALMLVGQIIFGMISDHFGLFLVLKRRIVLKDFLVVTCVLAGSAMIIFGR
ncbi:DMT family transporter [Zooshikella harenae]|uniref:DMT family transporter n=1 Tax=Zooshikella harenae TaxID=2827238 RepID=A0ABS5ZFY9_9GAMM|nr:DMT family transporter [Zooshikella harenae]MBU2712976.1 DMT family transporter [Zooshikella harenae]